MNLTIMLCARDAASTIERAVASTLPEIDCQLLLVDDGCSDNTIAIARQVAGDRLRVIVTPPPKGIPRARQAGLEACESKYAAWLDADDVWVPGRASRIVDALDTGADVFSDAIDLIDGASGLHLRRLDVPRYIQREQNPTRLFERNHLPGDTQVGFRVATFRSAGGYDAEVYGAESFDLLLRVIAKGAAFAYSNEVGYQMFAYTGSVSRNLTRQRAALALALQKHDYEYVRTICAKSCQSSRVAAWVLVSMAMFRNDPKAGVTFLEQASPGDADPNEILEPDGPWPLREGWRRAFQRGTCLLLIGGHDAEAASELERAEAIEPTAEGANNLGVAIARLGMRTRSARCFAAAIKRFPGYIDPRCNLALKIPDRITTHPLRRHASRSEYL